MKSILQFKKFVLLLVLATLTSMSANAQYCPSLPSSTADEEIYSVTMNGITNAYSCTTVAPGPGSILNQYSNFTTLGNMWNFTPGSTVNFTIEENECDGATYWSNGIAIWIDYNHNFSFNDPGEQVYIETATTVSPRNVTNSFVIPLTALLGQTTMRITVAESYSGATLTSCLSYFYGETEDYFINIGTNGPPQPPIANFYSQDTVWINSPYTLINTSSFQSRVFWDIPGENPLQPGYYRQAGFIDTAKYYNNLTYTFTSPGLKLVKLLAVNDSKRDSLRDSIYKYIYVDTPTQAPKAEFITFKRIMGITEEAQFVDLSNNGPTQWEWTIDPPCISCISDPSNGIANYFITGTGQPGQNVSSPRLAAFDPGQFKICLRVWNLRGKDSICKSQYIKVVEGNYMCSGSGGFVSTKTEGYLYGISGPYQTYARSSWPGNCPGFTIAPCADSITLYIERIKMWPSDSIEIFNGPNTSSPKLATLGASSTGQIPLTSAQSIIKGGSSISFRYKPGTVALPASYDSASFSIRWLSKPASYPKPISRIDIADTLYSNQLITYKNKSTGTLMKYSWDTDGNGVYDSTTANPTRIFLITVPTLRNICLITYNCVGSDTSCKQVAFLPVNRPPIARFTVDKILGFNTDTFNMMDQSANGVASWRWTFIPASVQYLNGTTQTSQSPQVRLTSPVPYTVRLTTTNAFGVDSLTKVAFINVSAYQTPGTGTTFSTIADATMGLRRIILAGIDSTFANTTSPSYQYINSSSQIGTMYRGGKYAIVLERPKNGTPLDYKVWIDKNYNANFETNELVLNKINNGDAQLIDTITISPSQAYGNTRMRVGLDLANSTQFNSVYSVIGMFKDFNVSINKDGLKPTIQLNGPSILRTEINKLFSDPGVTAIDNIEGNISSRVQTISTIDTTNIGVYNVKYFVTDYSGNTSDTLYRTVIVELNSTGPSITLVGGSTYKTNVKEHFIDPWVIALDNNGNNITTNVIRTTNVNTDIIGTYSARYSITDAFNFNKIVDRTIIVQDTTRPVLSPKSSPYLHQVNTAFDATQIINWSDNYNTKAQMTPTFATSVNPNIIGTYFVVYNLKDESNNSANQLTLQVRVTDLIPPTINVANNPLYVEVNEPFSESDVTVSDNYWPTSALYRSQTGNVRIDSLGTYYITYTVTDGSGNINTFVRTVIVRDTKAPVITLLGGQTINLIRWTTFVDPGVQIFDNYNSDAQIRKNLTVTSNLPLNANSEFFGNEEGLFTVQYKVRDISNNISAIVIRNVNVIANATSIQDAINANNILSIYPNPNNGMVKMKMYETTLNDVTVKIYNAIGGLAKTITIKNNDLTEKQIDLSSFASGVYLIQIEAADKVYTHKISVIK